jgi:methylglutaconyl-CoA hydratase
MTEPIKLGFSDGVATLTLDRPEIHNAFDDVLIQRLTELYQRFDGDPAVRVVVLAATGPYFSAGGDLNWMRRMAGYSFEENLADGRALAELMRTVDTLSKPTIARVQGSAFAGGVGLIAASDIAIAADHAEFAITEVRVGLIPAVISPYLVRAMGVRATRRFSITGERFSAADALRTGLVHELVPADGLDAAITRTTGWLAKNSPQAMTGAKRLLVEVDRPLDTAVIERTARVIAEQRASADGKEGVTAFLEKRKAVWTGQ